MENISDVASRARVPLSLLTDITDGFSKDRVIRQGGLGDVYKGVHGDGHAIAVMKFYPVVQDIDGKQFQQEFLNLMKLQHRNIVRLINYCYEKTQILVPCNGKHVFTHKTHMAVCFEYFPQGSLERYVSDASSGLDWQSRFRIIKSMCEGIRYLHEGSKHPILHLDLKPCNILLDQNMEVKIGYFGMQRLLGEGNVSRMGTIGYMPPEFVERQVISHKFDIYSIGIIIIQLMTGSRPGSNDLYSHQFAEMVHEKWKERLQRTMNRMSVERSWQQVTKCLNIALKCVEYDRHQRPSIGDILHRLNEIEILIPEDDRVAFMLGANSPKRYLTEMPPRSARTIDVTKCKQQPSIASDSGDLFTLYGMAVGQYDLLRVDTVQYNKLKKAQETAGAADEVQVATLNVMCDRKAAESAGTSQEVIILGAG